MHIMTEKGWRPLHVKTVNHNEFIAADPQLDFMRAAGYGGYLLTERKDPGVFRRNSLTGKYRKLDQFKFKRMLYTGEGI